VDDIECIGYANEFTQVIINMMSNSKDAFIANNIKDRKITIQIKKQDKTLLISHTDNAGGIPDDVIEHVFEPYFTTKHKSQGTGLGLYMSKMLIEDGMSGSIAVVNVNGGAKFVIEIDLEANLSDRVVGDFCTLEDGSDLLNKQLDGII
jgi:C4-dicarboxylate-specific signal transduction histidine kinase